MDSMNASSSEAVCGASSDSTIDSRKVSSPISLRVAAPAPRSSRRPPLRPTHLPLPAQGGAGRAAVSAPGRSAASSGM